MTKSELCGIILVILMCLAAFTTLPSFVQEAIASKDTQSDNWYTIGNGWINVTKSNYKWAASNSSSPKEYFFFYRYSNSTPFQDWRGLLWSESLGYGTPAYTFMGQGTAYLIYNDTDVLSYKRVLTGSSVDFEQYYTFWKDAEYFSWESKIVSKTNYVQNQIQFGLYIRSDGTNRYAFMGYKDGEVVQGIAPNQWGLGSLPITSEAVENNTAFPWQAVKSYGHNCSVGWTLTYSDSPWTMLSAGKGGDGELQFQTFYSNPATNAYFRLPYVPFEFKIGTIVYPFYGDQAEWYRPVQNLAKQLYSNMSAPRSFNPLCYAYAQHDPSSYADGGTIANRIGVIALGWTSFNGFFLKDTTTWNYYPDVERQPLYIRAGTTEWPYPDMAVTTDTGTKYLHVQNSPVDSSSQSASSDSTSVWLKFSNALSDIGWNVTIETWGDSDKFNVTLLFNNKVSQKIKSAWTYLRTQNQINPMEFTQITPGITADYVINDPYRGYGGYLIKRLEGNASEIGFSQSGAQINFVNNSSPQTVAAGTAYYVKLMLWAHYGKVFSEGQITGYHTNPTLPDSRQHFSYSPHVLNGPESKLFVPYEVWNSAATFPMMKPTATTEYTLTAIASGTRTFTLFLNKTIFTDVNQVSDVDSWNYDSTTGNLTFSATFSGAKKIKINLLPPPPPPLATIGPESADIQLGESVLFTSSVSQGLPPYTYQWYVNGSAIQGANQNTYSFMPLSSGIYRFQLQVFDSLGQPGLSNIATVNASGGYRLDVQVRDWDLVDPIQDADVYVGLIMQKSDSQGWVNWTGVFGAVQVKVNYHGYWVNDTSLVINSDTTLIVQCRLYDVAVTVRSSNQEGVVYQSGVTALSMTGEKLASGFTGVDGKVRLSNLPNGTLTFTANSTSGPIVTSNQLVNVDEQSITLVASQNFGTASLLWQQTGGSGEVVQKTFGNTNFEMWMYITLNANYKLGSRFQLSESGSITKISANIRAASGVSNVKACIYDDNNGAPNSLKAVSIVTNVDTSRKWWNFSFSSPVNLAPGQYWLCLLSSADTYFYCDFGASKQTAYTWTDNFNTGPTPTFGQAAYDNYALNVFATYETGSGPPSDIKFYKWTDGTQKDSISSLYDLYADTWTVISNSSYGIKNNNVTYSKGVKLWVESGTNLVKVNNMTIVIRDPAGNVHCVWTTTTWGNIGEGNSVSWTAASNTVYTIEILIKGSSTVNQSDSVTVNLKITPLE